MRKFKCSVCEYVYDEAAGIPGKSIAPGTKWENIPNDFVCPQCSAPKSVFKLLDEAAPAPVFNRETAAGHAESVKELSAGEISAICSNLAVGCEMQRLVPEMEAFRKIADYYKAKMAAEEGLTLADAAKILDEDLNGGYPAAFAAARAVSDRGALRALVWSEKSSVMMKSLFELYAKDGDAMLENTKIYVCEICGFIHLGDTPPEICPVCKVPKYKMPLVERR